MNDRWLSAQKEARVAGVLYFLNMLTGIAAMVLLSRKMQAEGNAFNMVAAVLYTGVTLLLWHLFRRVNSWISALAAVFSLLGCWLPSTRFMPTHMSNFVFFGVYCLLIALLIVRSRFMPRIVGVLMACAGICWLTTISASLTHTLAPFPMIVGLIGEGTLIFYLMFRRLDERGWQEQASKSLGAAVTVAASGRSGIQRSTP